MGHSKGNDSAIAESTKREARASPNRQWDSWEENDRRKRHKSGQVAAVIDLTQDDATSIFADLKHEYRSQPPHEPVIPTKAIKSRDVGNHHDSGYGNTFDASERPILAQSHHQDASALTSQPPTSLKPSPLSPIGLQQHGNPFSAAVQAFNEKQTLTQAHRPNTDDRTLHPNSSQDGSLSGNMILSISDPNHTDKLMLSQAPRTAPALCAEQEALVQLILSGANVFYTGSAGCGKSTVLKAAVERLKLQDKQVRIVAPTGRAAVDIGGQTIFAYAGLTPDSLKQPLDKLKAKAYGKVVSKRFSDTDVLVIDEISMVENQMLERLNELMISGRQYQNRRQNKDENAPFGGVQCVFLGDFFQLPPVKPFSHCISCGKETIIKVPDRVYKCQEHGEYFDQDKWAFRAKCWEKADFQCVNLIDIHRQSDGKFISLLEKCRMAVPFTGKERAILLNHRHDVTGAVQLFSTRAEVKHINDIEFARLNTEKRTFRAHDTSRIQTHHQQSLGFKGSCNEDGFVHGCKDHRFEPIVELKTGMLVILLINLDVEAGLINGAQGKIIGWTDITENTLPVAFDSKIGKQIKDARRLTFGEHAELKAQCIRSFVSQQPYRKWPLVEFAHGQQVPIMAECSLSDLGEEEPFSVIGRTQIPLLPAWAMSIHKSQGMTLSKVIVDLSRTFADGQIYVALSRAKSLYGLKVVGLRPSKCSPNEEVVDFLDSKFGIKKNMYKNIF